MFIRNDVGTEVVNADQTFSFGIVAAAEPDSSQNFVHADYSVPRTEAIADFGSPKREANAGV